MPIGQLTILLGANDTGKSTLLRSLYDDLRNPPRSEDEAAPRADCGAIFAELTDQELAQLTPDRDDLHGCGWELGGYEIDHGADLLLLTGFRMSPQRTSNPDRWIATLSQRSLSPASFATVLKTLRDSRIVCFEPIRHRGGRHFLTYWCLPPMHTLDIHVRRALEASTLNRFVIQRHITTHGHPPPRKSYRRLSFLGVDHLHATAAPVVVAPLASNERVMPPNVLITPTAFDDIRNTITEAVTGVVIDARYGEDYGFDEELGWSQEALQERSAPRVWLQSDQNRWTIDPVALGTLSLLRAEAQRLLPDFVDRRYAIVLTFRPVDQWFHLPPLDFTIRQRDSNRPSFPPEDLAQGFHLWVHLAFAGALLAIDGLRAQLQALREQDDTEYFEAIDDDALDDMAEAGPTPLQATVAEIEWAAMAASPSMPSHIVLSQAPDAPFATLARRVIIVDEPERHLHPRLQRHAAHWLGNLATAASAQCVIASHATAFLAVGDAVLNYISRIDDQVVLTPVEGEALDALDAVARDVGFDRGELLSTVSCFLLVEGEHDRVTLEGIFSRELRSAGIFIVPLRGSPRRSLLDVDTLWRFMTAPVAVALDNLPLDDVAAAQADAGQLHRLRHPDATPEAKAVATILQAAQGTEKCIKFLGHAGKDLIDTLHDDAIRAEFPAWPGHHAMQQSWAVYEAENHSGVKSRKNWLQATYCIDNSTDTYVRLAETHVRLGLRPPALAAIVEAAIRLALEYRAGDTLLDLPLPSALDMPRL